MDETFETMTGSINSDWINHMALMMDEFLYPLKVKYSSKYEIYIDTSIKDFAGWKPLSDDRAKLYGENLIKYGLENGKIRLRKHV